MTNGADLFFGQNLFSGRTLHGDSCQIEIWCSGWIKNHWGSKVSWCLLWFCSEKQDIANCMELCVGFYFPNCKPVSFQPRRIIFVRRQIWPALYHTLAPLPNSKHIIFFVQQQAHVCSIICSYFPFIRLASLQNPCHQKIQKSESAAAIGLSDHTWDCGRVSSSIFINSHAYWLIGKIFAELSGMPEWKKKSRILLEHLLSSWSLPTIKTFKLAARYVGSASHHAFGKRCQKFVSCRENFDTKPA